MLELSETQFDEFIEQNSQVLIEFGAPWCVPCRRLDPVLESLAEELTDWAFAKINVDEAGKLTTQLRILSVPTILIAKHGGGQKLLPNPRPSRDALRGELTNFVPFQ